MTEGAIEGAEDKLTPDSDTVRTALKGAAAAAAIGAAAAAAREIGTRIHSDGES